MIVIKRSRVKAGAVLTLAVALISAGAALSWENPSGNYVDDSSYTLKVSNSSMQSWIEFYYRVNDGNWKFIGNGTYNGNYWTETLDFGAKGADGDEFDLRANNTNSSVADITVTSDQQDPGSFSISSPSNGYTNSEDPTIEVKASDSTSGINNISVTVDDSNGNQEGTSNCSSSPCSVDLSGLSDGDYDVTVEAFDNVNKSASNILSFTVDTSYDGDSSPEFDPDGGTVLLGGEDDQDITVTLEEKDEGSDITVKCLDGDGDEIDSETKEVSGTTDFTCQVDGEDYAGTKQNIKVEMCDEAGNCEESEEKTFRFDANPPTIMDLKSEAGVSTFNSEFEMKMSVADDVSSIETLEYFFDDESVDEGEGVNVTENISGFENAKVTVDPGDLSSGSHTVYFRAGDAAGRWSETESFNFEYLPSKEPEVSLETPGKVSVVAGETSKLDLTVRNTGDFYIEKLQVKASSEVYSANRSVSDLQPGESVEITLDLSPSESDIGKYSMDVSTDNPSTTSSVTLSVKANSGQKKSIQSRLEEYEQELESIESNISSLKKKVSGEREDRLSSNLSSFKEKVERARSAVESGRYYEAEEALSDIDKDMKSAKTSYRRVRKEYRNSRFWMFVYLGLGAVIVSGLGGFVFLSREGYIDPEEYREKLGEIQLGDTDLDDIEHRIKNLLGQEPEADEFEWDGFEDH